MEDKTTKIIVLVVCAVIGLLAGIATRKILIGIGMTIALYLAWGMWLYIKDITKDERPKKDD
jgi:hypothetical protein